MNTQPDAPIQEQVLDFGAIFDTYMAGNVKTWQYDRALTLGASEIFGCLRAAWFEKRGKEFGYEVDPDFVFEWGATERGNIIENNFVVPGLRAGLPPEWKLHLAGDGQQTLVVGKASATLDGIIQGLDPTKPLRVKGKGQDILIPPMGTDCIVVEFKSIDPRATLAEERVKHHGQTQVQLGVIRELTPWKPTHSVILYINASFLSDQKPFVVEFKPEIYETAKQRANDVWRVDNPMMIVPEGKFDDSCKHCKWQMACTGMTANVIKALGMNELEDDHEIQPIVEAAAIAYIAARDAVAEAEKRQAQVGERLKECLLDANVRKVKGAAVSVSWSPVKGKTYIDTEMMAAAGIDLEPYTKTGPGHDRLTVKKVAPKNKVE